MEIKRELYIKKINQMVKNQNLIRHMLAVEAVMKKLARYFKEDQTTWGLAGLIHDLDYEVTEKNAVRDHTKITIKWLKSINEDKKILDAVASHAWGFVKNAPKPKSLMDWALFSCDELTGLIVAVALVKPDKKLSSVSVTSIMRKWKERSFARGVKREAIELGAKNLGLTLENLVQLSLEAMKEVSEDLGL